MADESRHTPVPWQHTGGDIWVDTREQVCCGRGTIECCGEPDVTGGQELVARAAEEDAAFIVRAVNSHQKLVEALEKARRYLGGSNPLHVSGGYQNRQLRAEIENALAAARTPDTEG